MGQVLGIRATSSSTMASPASASRRTSRTDSWPASSKTGPNIKVVGEFDGQYAPGPEQSGISNLLVGNPDVQGVMTQGYCTPVFNAFKQAGKRDVPATCYGYNGELGACAQSGRACAVLSGSPVVMQIAMKVALDKLEGTADTAEEQDGPGADDALHHADAEGRTSAGAGVKVEVMKAREELLPESARRTRAPVHAAADTRSRPNAGGEK